MADIKSNVLVSGGSLREDQLLDKMNLDDLASKSHAGLVANHAGSKGTIIEVVEEALKWRLEANNRKQQEIIDSLAEKVTEQKRTIDLISNESSTEFLELKNQIVEAASDVLLQVQDNLMPAYEKQLF